eukprot:TRINITY_DN373_c0_g1_i1.p2 TRINITY_DN373_c0_g1~~TRINITY_DN373_c0_g1_i1.p2  ORF type:complete len:313 (-),score=70.42 TRINITY_DN373_c0_g1_i1:4123-5061(-)
MGRNRSSSYAESSDDDFALSEEEKSSSRLKRPPRRSVKPRRLAVRSPQTSSFQLDEDDDDDDVICVPDSLEQHEHRKPPPQDNIDLENAPQNPSAENTMESAPKSEAPATADESETRRVDVPPRSSNEKESAQSKRSSRVLKKRKTYAISDSESEASAHELDDAYNSADDSPVEEDDDIVESDFELSPKRPTKKRKAVSPAKRPTPLKKGKPQVKARVTPSTTALKNTKKPPATAQRSAPKQKKTSATLSTGSGKKRLGARIPVDFSALSSISNSAQKPRRPSLKPSPSPLIRSGLSRNASVPPLHSYLKKN